MIQPKLTHSWQLSVEEALVLQCELATKVVIEDRLSNSIKRIAGVDVAYNEQDERLFAAVVVLDAETLEAVEISSIVDVARFPYIPGLFSFRELPPIAKALENLACIPDLIVCDGQGIAHPRRFGLACHLGVLYDLPTIGCSKTRLLGDSEIPGQYRGDVASLMDNSERIGHVLRTQDRVKPVYVSVGHRISLKTACYWILKLAPLYRLPETTRLADRTVRNLLRTTLLKQQNE